METPALEPCHNHRGKAPLTPASGLPIPSPKTGLTTQKLTAAQVPGNYKFKLPGYKALIQVQAGNIILSHIQSIVVALKREGHPPQFCDLGNSFPLL